MKKFFLLSLAVLSLAAFAPQPAKADVDFAIGFGGPAYYGGYPGYYGGYYGGPRYGYGPRYYPYYRRYYYGEPYHYGYWRRDRGWHRGWRHHHHHWDD